jgi:hypothetical protein
VSESIVQHSFVVQRSFVDHRTFFPWLQTQTIINTLAYFSAVVDEGSPKEQAAYLLALA